GGKNHPIFAFLENALAIAEFAALVVNRPEILAVGDGDLLHDLLHRMAVSAGVSVHGSAQITRNACERLESFQAKPDTVVHHILQDRSRFNPQQHTVACNPRTGETQHYTVKSRI